MTAQGRDLDNPQPKLGLQDEASPRFAGVTGLLSSIQDQSLADVSGTGLAPSCPSPVSTSVMPSEPAGPIDYQPGIRIDDFEIIALLGRGAFGAVYLARQVSLDRQVALKVTTWQGGEGRKMARLEHDSIVRVFSETALDNHARLLCMQFVAGPTLQAVLDELEGCPPEQRSGQRLLETIDRLAERSAEFDPAAMRNRELLAGLDWGETVCWIGERLAEALDYAHSHGVIHRDIKPGNIMLNQYGRPLLVDFNLAFQPLDRSAGADRLGGTLAYMAPEHLNAFAPDAAVPTQSIAQAADIYSLGVVLYQSATGALPFTQTPTGKTRSEMLRAMAAQREVLPPPLPVELSPALDQVIARCLLPDPTDRFSSARELSDALEGCRHYQAAEKAMPDFGRMRAAAMRHPRVWLFVLALAPHLVASLINIAYNYIRIIGHLDPAQQDVFWRIVAWYDPIGYLLGIILALRVVLPVTRAWSLVNGRIVGDRQQIDSARRLAATWPFWAGVIACLCWMPGGIVFPLVLKMASGSLKPEYWVHLLISFVLSGLIAATYSMHFVQWISLCVAYPKLWCDRQGFRATAAAELRSVPIQLRGLQVTAGLIPFIGALIILLAGPPESVSGAPLDRSFSLLVSGLIILGLAGSYLTMFTTGLLWQAWAALTGSNESSPRRVGSSRSK